MFESAGTKDKVEISLIRNGKKIAVRETAPCGTLKGYLIQFGQMLSFGTLFKRYTVDLVTSAGKAEVAGLLSGVTSGAFSYIAIGTGTAAPAIGDTALQAETHRGDSTEARETTTVTNDTATFTHTFTFSGSFAITEAGVLDAASVGVLLCRQTFAAINVVNGDSLQIKFKVQIS